MKTNSTAVKSLARFVKPVCKGVYEMFCKARPYIEKYDVEEMAVI